MCLIIQIIPKYESESKILYYYHTSEAVQAVDGYLLSFLVSRWLVY